MSSIVLYIDYNEDPNIINNKDIKTIADSIIKVYSATNVLFIHINPYTPIENIQYPYAMFDSDDTQSPLLISIIIDTDIKYREQAAEFIKQIKELFSDYTKDYGDCFVEILAKESILPMNVYINQSTIDSISATIPVYDLVFEKNPFPHDYNIPIYTSKGASNDINKWCDKLIANNEFINLGGNICAFVFNNPYGLKVKEYNSSDPVYIDSNGVQVLVGSVVAWNYSNIIFVKLDEEFYKENKSNLKYKEIYIYNGITIISDRFHIQSLYNNDKNKTKKLNTYSIDEEKYDDTIKESEYELDTICTSMATRISRLSEDDIKDMLLSFFKRIL